MPMHDPDPEDPLELCAIGVPDPGGQSSRLMAECFAVEFLRLGFTSEEVLAMFRSSSYSLPHRAWLAIGEHEVEAIVAREAAIWCRSAPRMPSA